MFFSPVLPSGAPTPFASATDPTLHRQPWQNTHAMTFAARLSPRKMPSRCRELLQCELLRPSQPSEPSRTASMPSSSRVTPSPPRFPTERRRKTVTAGPSSPTLEPSNVDELQWFQHRWLGKHGKASDLKSFRAQVALMRRWFESLDADGSGEVGLDELEDPLVSVGLARNRADVQELIDRVDRDGSGEITFAEFLSMMYPPRAARRRDQQQPRLALHAPKHRIALVDAETASSGALATPASPPKSLRGRQSPRSNSLTIDAALPDQRHLRASPQPSNKRSGRKQDADADDNGGDGGPNPVVKLFNDLQSGRLGDLAVPFPVLITAYRRRMLLNAHMAEDPAARSLGTAVLRALESSRRATTLPGSTARRQSIIHGHGGDGGCSLDGPSLRLPTL